jgi:hypothetical protein
LRPRDSLSIRDESERRLVNEVIARYRGLPEEQRWRQPALLNAIGKLEAVAGSFEAAGRDFAAVADLVDDRPVELKSQVKINDGQWHHLAVTPKIGNLEIFVDGMPQGRKSGQSATGSITTDLCALGSERHHIKKRWPWGNHHFEGCLDEFCLFAPVMTGQEIAVLAGRTRGGS